MNINTPSGFSQGPKARSGNVSLINSKSTRAAKPAIKIALILFVTLFLGGMVILYTEFYESQKNTYDIMLQVKPEELVIVPKVESTKDIPKNPANPLGLITRVYKQNDTRYLEIDQFKLYFSGTDLEEAVEDGICPSIEECDWPNNFAIGDKDRVLTTYKISSDVTIDLSGLEPYRNMWSEELQEWIPLFPENPTIDEFSSLIDSNGPAGLHAGGAFGIVLSGDVVTHIYGIYLP